MSLQHYQNILYNFYKENGLPLFNLQPEQDSLQKVEQKLKEIQLLIEHKDDSLDDWIDEQAARRLTGIGRSTLFNLRRDGKITSSKLGKQKVFYRKSDLITLLDKNEKL